MSGYLTAAERIGLFGLLLSGAALISGQTHAERVNVLLSHDNDGIVGDVSSCGLTPGGNFVVYAADDRIADQVELFSVPGITGTPVRLSDILSFGHSVFDYKISPDGAHVAYRISGEGLCTVPTGGGAVSHFVTDNSTYNYAFTPDSSKIVYMVYRASRAGYEVYSVPAAGGDPMLLDFISASADYPVFAITPDSSRVIYKSSTELHSVAVNGGAPTLLFTTTTSDPLQGVIVSDDSSTVAFTTQRSINVVPADGGAFTQISRYEGTLTSSFVYDNYRFAPVSGDLIYERNGCDPLAKTDQYTPCLPTHHYFDVSLGDLTSKFLMSSEGVVGDIDITSDGVYIVYLTLGGTSPAGHLYYRQFGDTVGTLLAEGDIADYRLAGDDETIFYTIQSSESAEQNGVYSIGIEAGGTPQRVTPAIESGNFCVDFKLSRDESKMVCLLDQVDPVLGRMFVVSTDGSDPVKLLDGSDPDPIFSSLQFAPQDAGIVLRARTEGDDDGLIQAYYLTLDGSSSLVVNAPIAAKAPSVERFFPSPAGTDVLFGHDYRNLKVASARFGQEEEVDNSMFVVDATPLPGSDSFVTLKYQESFNPTYPLISAIYSLDVRSPWDDTVVSLYGYTTRELRISWDLRHAVANDGSRIVYTQVDGLYSIRPDASARMKVSRSLEGSVDGIGAFAIMDNNTYVVYTEGPEPGAGQQLYISSIVDASFAPSESPLLGGINVSQLETAGANICYRASVGGGVDNLFELQLNGSPRQINGQLAAGESISGFRLAPDGSRVLYWLAGAGAPRLFTAAVPNGTPAELAPGLTGYAAWIGDISPDSQWFILGARANAADPGALYRIPLAGGAFTRLTDDLPTSGTLSQHVVITPDGSDVLFAASYEDPMTRDLYRVPSEGGDREKLNRTLVPGTAVADDFQAAGNGVYTVYRAWQGTGALELYSTYDTDDLASSDGAYVANFFQQQNGWEASGQIGNFDPVHGEYNAADNAIMLTTHNNANAFGYWQSPLIDVVSPTTRQQSSGEVAGTTGPESLYRAVYTVGGSTDSATAPVLRLRTSSANFERSDLTVISSVGDGDLSPNPYPRDYIHYFTLPEGQPQFLATFELLNAGGIDAANASLFLYALDILHVGTASAGSPTMIADEDLGNAATRDLWSRHYDGTGTLSRPMEWGDDDGKGLLIRGSTGLTTPGVVFGYNETEIPAPLVGGMLYRVRATFASDATEAAKATVPVFRLRVNSSSLQFSAYANFDSVNAEARTPYAGAPQDYDLWFLAPQQIDGDTLLVAFDYLFVVKAVDEYNTDQDDPEVAITLRNLRIDRFNIPEP